MIITESLIRKLLSTVDAGLTAGLGTPEPGNMCVEAAISYALGEPHSDRPSCVDAAVRAGKIALNECEWSSNAARAAGMRRVAIAQLGSKGMVDPIKYVTLLAQYTTTEIVPLAAQYAQSAAHSAHSAQSSQYAAESAQYAQYAAQSAADCAQYAADSAAEYAQYAADCSAQYAAQSAAKSAKSAKSAQYTGEYAAKSAHSAQSAGEKDIALRLSADLMVRALQECGSPGCEWLWICDEQEGQS